MSAHVVVLDAGTGNVRSAVRALQRVGAQVQLTADYDAVMAADGLVVPGVGAFRAVMEKMQHVRAERMIERRIAGGQAVLGICVGLQVLFERGTERSEAAADGAWPGLGQWPGSVDLLPAAVVPHMGWSPVQAAPDSVLLDGLDGERFYFVHSYAVQSDPTAQLEAEGTLSGAAPKVSWAEHKVRFVAAIEQGQLYATQFHPEKSGDAGAELLRNWVRAIE
ncbi:MAG: imidazole glycerol phosphate synthase subunit HisH [Arcanobacterium sp.]|nr:imidazole glycerol phosphate synthase subunit HisH [Arcanobacterium sp.]MDY5588662.1 imidazole glycerol phosphate synthase subunit HisH [Arcanobacterium sp.]